MQTWITDFDFYKSASNLNRQHLHANIYESIQILASLLDVNDRLVNPKISVKNYPQAKLWEGYELYLYRYIQIHFMEWCVIRGYNSEINYKNITMLIKNLDFRYDKSETRIPEWITDELIQTHRSVLIQKEIEKEFDLNYDISMLEYDDDIISCQKIELQNELYKKISYHYRNLWPNTPTNLKMRYDWR